MNEDRALARPVSPGRRRPAAVGARPQRPGRGAPCPAGWAPCPGPPSRSPSALGEDLCGKILTGSLPGGLGVEDGERIVAVQGGLQERHGDGRCQGSQAFAKGGTLSGNKDVGLDGLALTGRPRVGGRAASRWMTLPDAPASCSARLHPLLCPHLPDTDQWSAVVSPLGA